MDEQTVARTEIESVHGLYWFSVAFFGTLCVSFGTALAAYQIGFSLMYAAGPFLLYHGGAAAVLFCRTQRGPRRNQYFLFDAVFDYFAVALVELVALLPVGLRLPYLVLGLPLYASFGVGLFSKEKCTD